MVLGGYRDLAPGEQVEVEYADAVKFIRSQNLEFDFAGGSFPFRENGHVKYINMTTPLHPSFGYGLIGVNALMGLMDRGLDISVTTPFPDWLQAEVRDRMDPKLFDKLRAREVKIAEVGLSHTIPAEFHCIPSPRKIGWSMWEATRLPRNWIKLCQMCERIIVPASGQVPIFEEAGVPIHVVSDGASVENFTLKKDRSLDPEKFTFISWSRMSSRKCPTETVECFQRAFQGKNDVRLVMKTIQGMFGGGTIGIPQMNDPRIEIINDDWPQSKLVELCHNAHAMVFLSRGEGFGCPTIQAMATGLPTILSNHSGLSDQCDPKYNYPVGLDPLNPYEISPLGGAFGSGDDVLDWWTPNYDEAIEQMRYVYNNRKEAKAKGIASAKWVRQKFSNKNMIDGLLSVLELM